MKIITFASQQPAQEQALWLASLQKLLPDENIILFEQLTPEQVEDVDIAIVANPKATDLIRLAQLPNLAWIQSLWAGVEKLATESSLQTIPIVRLVDDTLAKIMAEAVLAWTLYLHRNMPEYLQQQAKKQWLQLPYKAPTEQRITVLGTGELGMAAINSLVRANFTVSAWSRKPKSIANIKHFTDQEGLRAVLPQTDILISLLPLTSQTANLLSNNTLSLLPQGAKLINFSRGGIVNSDDLLALLNNGHLAHAVLDVFDVEPLPANSLLWSHEKITILPHISAPTQMASAALVVANNIKQYRLEGIIPTAVDKTCGY
ncbi:glyoxylate/hydroxypyruvate reductase A [Colwellia sp. D2M02]|uniref:2-hydroxyacid dehydrogenase n=1 Tax=Colwellia sp. D2M02 TaxID=2841562 RepID=UPI001C08D043|nr:glyoxylate/hydroxypyruvate reductase A [Colwellia sp. D2M02]MBU2892475.1 glyoxylate/hydroxypyruvate reductase A [Colwellia sp. D2M02]